MLEGLGNHGESEYNLNHRACHASSYVGVLASEAFSALMFPPLQVLSRYTGALAREARLAHLSGVFVSPALVAISRRRLLSAPRLTSTSSTSVEWSHQRHVSSSSAVKPASAQERRREFWKERQSPSERVYVGNLTDANRHEIISFVNALPGLVDIFDRMLYALVFLYNTKH